MRTVETNGIVGDLFYQNDELSGIPEMPDRGLIFVDRVL